MAKNLLDNDNRIYYAVAVAVIILLAAAFVLVGNRGANPANNAVASVTPAPSAPACVNGTKKDFLCIGSISGRQTYYECVNGVWVSNSTFENRSECTKTFGPNETIGETENASAIPTVPNATATPTAIASVVPSATPLPVVNSSAPAFINMSVSGIRTSNADIYWFTNANATGTLRYGDSPGVRRQYLVAQPAAFSQYEPLLSLSPGKTYYFDVEVCANSTCISTPELNFSTPAVDKYLYDGTTNYYPGGSVNYVAAQLNP